MSTKWDAFTTSSTPLATEFAVGYATNVPGGERRWLWSDVRTLMQSTLGTAAFQPTTAFDPAGAAAAITKSSVGLGNVENTALSTWAGSTNVTTLGTIATGVWQGTAIGDTYISSAATWNAKESALTFSNGVTRTVNAISIDLNYAPTWTGIHTFTPQVVLTGGASFPSGGAITGAAGAITLTASGSNQSVSLSPSGSGLVRIIGAASNSAILSMEAPTGGAPIVTFKINSVAQSQFGSAVSTNNQITGSAAGDMCFRNDQSLSILFSTDAGTSIAMKVVASTGQLTLPKNISSTTTGTGTLVVTGGVGVSQNLFVGGTGSFASTLTAANALTVTTGTASLKTTVIAGLTSATALTITQTARTSGVLPYIKWTIPTDTAQTAATESPGLQVVSGTRTWATTGTVALQRENYFAGPTYASASASQTFTDACTVYIDKPLQGTNAVFTRAHSLAIVDLTSSTDSITGGFVIATTLGTTATSVGIGGGNINAGGSGVFGSTLSVGGALAAGSNASIVGSATATGSAGFSLQINGTITASNNSDSLEFVQVNGTWAKGAFTSLTGYGVFIANPAVTGAGTIDNHYGLYVQTPTRGTANYAIFTVGGTVSFGSTLDASSTTAASTVLAGGLGVAKALYVGGLTAFGAVATVNFANPRFEWYDTGAALNAKRWDMLASGGVLSFRIIDDGNTSAATYLAITRTGFASATSAFTGAVSTTSTITTGAPSGGTAGAWKLGILVTTASAFDTTRYIQLDVGGTLYKLAVCT